MPDFDPRRGEPGQRFDSHDAEGNPVSLKADDEGVIQPKSEAEVALADTFGLPVARKVLAERKDDK